MKSPQTEICNCFGSELSAALAGFASQDIFILTDSNTQKICLPALLNASEKLGNCRVISIPSGDENKNINSLAAIWQYLSGNGATRKSLIINLGGGMVSDIGGFAASTFKRGIKYINIPTTLLGAVDAATGGKTGINFAGLKNEVGVFAPATAVLIEIDFLRTLDRENILSGFAEMIKHALIYSAEEWAEILRFDFETIDFEHLKTLVKQSVRIKENIVAADPHEQNLRKALNLGHTFGHAFESFSYTAGKPALHGYAVAWGLVCELYLSHLKLGFPKRILLQLKNLVNGNYGNFEFTCHDYEKLFELMTHDKKNESKEINFTLLKDIGIIEINQTATKEVIFECLDFFAGSF